ncbi:MAG: metal ABC transporter permease [Deltaproteobacteria bacterium]|nr:metal ABC transporter permease [Deltaproteobacteria bacterium]
MKLLDTAFYFILLPLLFILTGYCLRPDLSLEMLQYFSLWWQPILASMLTGGLLALMGSLSLASRQIFVGLALPQGAGLSIFLYLWIVVGKTQHEEQAFLAYLAGIGGAFLTLSLFSLLKKRSSISAEGLLGLIYLVGSAGILILGDVIGEGHHYVESLLFGNAVAVTEGEFWGVVFTASIALIFLWPNLFKILSVLADPDFFTVAHFPVRAYRLFFYLFLCLSISLSLEILGALATFAGLLIPAWIANQRTHSSSQAFVTALGLGLILPALAYYYSYIFLWPAGASLVVVGMGFLLISQGIGWLFRKKTNSSFYK